MTETMSTIDHFWYQLDHARNPMAITALFEFDTPLDAERLRNTIEQRWLRFNRFQHRVSQPFPGIGRPKWVSDLGFNLRSHIHRAALPSPGDKKALQEMIGDLAATPFDHSKPLWQIHLIENYGSGCAVFWRIHHCIADGIALIHVLLAMTDDAADASRPVPDAFFPLPSKETILSKMIKSAAQTKTNVFAGLETVFDKTRRRRFVQQVAETATILEKQIRMSPDPKTAFKGELSSRKDVAWSDPLPIFQVKAAGKSLQATVNDVLITAISGALRRYLIEKDKPVADLDLHISMPVNIRKAGMEYELGNKFGVVSLALPMAIEDPIERLKEITKRNNKIKKSVEPLLSYQILKTLGAAPGMIARQAANFFANKGTAVLSNVQGPKQPVYFAGNKIKNMMFWVPRSGDISMGISILSYADGVSVGISSDANIISEPQQLIDYFKEEIQCLFDLSANPKKVGLGMRPSTRDGLKNSPQKPSQKKVTKTKRGLSTVLNLGIRSMPFDELTRKYMQKDSKFININGTKVHYCDQGSGPVLLLLHGILSSLHTWDAWTALLSPHYRIIRFDLPGFGLTTRLQSAPYSRDLFLDFLNQFVETLGLEQIDIAGNSIGGYLAWNYAMQYPEKVNRLLLIDAVGYPQDLPRIMNFVNAPLIRNIAGHMAPWIFFEQSVRSIYGDKSKVTDQVIARYYDMASSSENRGAYVDVLRLLKNQCDSKALCSGIDTIKSKTLLMWGEKDPWVPVEIVKNWERDLVSSQTIIYDGVGHLPMEEIPRQSAKDAHLFLQKTGI